MYGLPGKWNTAFRRITCAFLLFVSSCTAHAAPDGFRGWGYFYDFTGTKIIYAADPFTACEKYEGGIYGPVYAIRPVYVDDNGSPLASPMYKCLVSVSALLPKLWYMSVILSCDLGYAPVWPGMCVKNPDRAPPPPSCSPTQAGFSVGDPVIVSSGENVQQELDLTFGNLKVRRTYRSRSTNVLNQSAGVGWLFWFDRQFNFAVNAKSATITMGNGSVTGYNGSIAGNLSSVGGSKHETLRALDSTWNEWELTTADGHIEKIRRIAGQYRLVSSHMRTGGAELYDYNESGLLRTVSDAFGRKLNVQWEGNNIVSITGPDYSVRYQYERHPDAVRGLVANMTVLSGVSVHDVNGTLLSSRRYQYDDEHYANLLTGIVDENQKQFARFVYSGGAQVHIAEHAGGAYRYTFEYPDNSRRIVTDPLGTTRTITIGPELGHAGRRVDGISQPAGAGCGAADNAMTYDFGGTVASRTDFDGRKVCYSNDPARKAAISRVEGLGANDECPEESDASISPQQQKTSTQWHPDWPIETKVAAPKLMSSFVYNGQPDSAGRLRFCAQGATLPNGKPLAVLCEKTEQESSDDNGGLGFAATPIGTPRIWRYTYNQFGQLLSQTEPVGANGAAGQATNVYYADTTSTHTLGDLQSTTNAAGETTYYLEYARHGLPTKMRHANGATTTLRYNQRQQVTHRLIQDAQGVSQESSSTYDDAGQLVRTQAADGSTVDYSYDDAHRLIGMRDSLGNTIQLALDGMGNVVKKEVHGPNGNLTGQIVSTYDALGRLERIQRHMEDIGTSYEYDAAANVTMLTDALQRIHRMEYDALGRMVQTMLPPAKPDVPGATINYGYDHRFQLTSVEDPRKLKTTYVMDGFGQRTETNSPDSGLSKYRFDQAGNTVSARDAREKTTDYQYDAAKRVTRIAYADGTASTFEYGKNGSSSAGQLVLMTDQSGQTSYLYDGFGNVLAKQQIVGSGASARTFALRYAYGTGGSNAGHATSITYPNGNRIDITHGSDGRPAALTLVAPGSVAPVVLLKDISYAPFGDVVSWNWGNSDPAKPNSYIRSFDLAGRISSYALGPAEKGGSVRTLHYDDADRITSMTHVGSVTAPNLDQQFTYDGLDRLLTVDGPAIHQGFEYDENGNRTEARFGANSYRNMISPTSNRLVSTNGPAPAKNNQFDAAGNMIGDGTISYAYDARGRLKTTTNAGVVTSYNYNGIGQRVSKSSGDVVKAVYVYNQGGRLMGEYDGAGRVLSETVYLGDLPVAVLTASRPIGPMIPPPVGSASRQAPLTSPSSLSLSATAADAGVPQSVISQYVGSTSVAYVYADHINTPRVLVRASDNAIVWRWDNTDPFGLIHPDENPSGLGTFSYNLRFPGQLYDQETNNHYNYFRDYDPQTGRYVESDPIGLRGGINTYAYVGGNPVSRTDSVGLWATDAHNYFIDIVFRNLDPAIRDIIKNGSAHADSMEFQDPSHAHMHAMSSSAMTPAQARRAMCQFIRDNMSDANDAMKNNDARYWFLLGMALHPVMDSTSPSHEGFQQWHGVMADGSKHGPWPSSLENISVARRPDHTQRTTDVMRRALAGDLGVVIAT